MNHHRINLKFLGALARGHLFQIFIALACLWYASTFAIGPAHLIQIENALLIATGIGVAIAYLPAAVGAARARLPSRSELLALGIWLAWTAIAVERAYSLVGRWLGKDILFFNTKFHTWIIFLTMIGGICHLAAPEVIDGRFPRRAYVVLGATVAGAAAIIGLMVTLFGF